jgi:hypothetical protein
LNGRLLQIYDSIREASSNNDIGKSNLISCCRRKLNKKNGKFIIVKGFTWRYYDETKGEKI